MADPRVAIVIPTLDAAGFLDPLLTALKRETRDIPAEILIVDSSSEDDTIEMARKAGVHVEVIPRSEFGHGRTRNWAASRTSAPFVAFLTEDALPLEGWLSRLLAPFDDPLVAGVYGRQLPRPGAYAFEAARIRRAFPAWRRVHAADFEAPGDAAAYATAGLPFSNVNSCIRHTVLESLPFPEVDFAEDARWAAEAVRRGHRIAYEPLARVLHSHSREKYISRARQREAFRALGPSALGHTPLVGLPIVALLNTLGGWDYVRADGHGVAALGQGYVDALTIEARKWWWTKSPPR